MDIKKNQVIEALTQSLGVVTDACRTADCPRSTFYKWCKEDEEFKAAVDDITEVALDFAESKLYSKIKEGDTTSIIFYLKTKGKKRGYIERMEQAVQVETKTKPSWFDDVDEKTA